MDGFRSAGARASHVLRRAGFAVVLASAFLLAGASVVARAAGPGTAFDSSYNCTEKLSFTISVPGVKVPPPQACHFSVTDGRIGGGATGVILDSAGNANVSMSAGFVSVKGKMTFTPSGGGVSVAGRIFGRGSTYGVSVAFLVVISGHRVSGGSSAQGSESAQATMVVPGHVPDATAGVPYKGLDGKPVSFCQRPVPLFHICGFSTKLGTETLSFYLGSKSALLPFGMHLDFRSGTLYGTPRLSEKGRTFSLEICRRLFLHGSETDHCDPTTLTIH